MLREDYRVQKLNFVKLLVFIITLNPFCLNILYRLSSWLHRKNVKIIPNMLRALGIILFSADISPGAKIGGGLRFAHTPGIVIGNGVVIGKNAHIFHNITLGSSSETRDGRIMPILGDNVSIFPGSVTVGPIMIGSNVSIGANSYVVKDFPDNVVLAGSPAKPIKQVDVAASLECM